MAPQAGSVAAALPYGNYLGGIALKGGSQHEKNSLRSQGVIIARPSTKKGTGSFTDHCQPSCQSEKGRYLDRLITTPLEVSGSGRGVISNFAPRGFGIPTVRFIYIPSPTARSPWHDSAPPGSGSGTPSPGSEGDRSIIPLSSLTVSASAKLQPNNRSGIGGGTCGLFIKSCINRWFMHNL